MVPLETRAFIGVERGGDLKRAHMTGFTSQFPAPFTGKATLAYSKPRGIGSQGI